MGALIMGVITAGFGGILRDLLLNRTPTVIIDYVPYLLISSVGGLLISALIAVGPPKVEAAIVVTVFIVVLRAGVILAGWSLPAI